MNRINNYIYLFATAVLFGLLAFSCSDESPVAGSSGLSDVVFQVKMSDDVSVHAGTRAEGEEKESIFDRFPVGVDFVADKSRIRVCSVDRNPSASDHFYPNYDEPYKSEDRNEHPNRYHEYICQTKKNYEEYSTFTTWEGAVALQWDQVDDNGTRIPDTGNILSNTFDGGFYLFAAMYPYTYQRPKEDGGKYLYVRQDQTYDKALGEEKGHFAANLLINDIRLCHKMFGYDQFRTKISLDFYHSLCMLVVNVKIPLHHQSDGQGFEIDKIANSPLAMTIEKIGRYYEPNYAKVYDKDEAILVEAKFDDATPLDKIEMFHTPNFRTPNNTTPGTFKVEDCYVIDEEDYEGEKRPVMWMQFCAILPFQQLTNANTDANIHFQIAGKNYRCYFSRISEPVKLEQGHVTIVSMYIPRGDSDPVLVGAHLKEWERKRTPIISLQ